MKNLIDRERLRENRNRIAEKNKAGIKDTKAAPAKAMVAAAERALQVAVDRRNEVAKVTRFAISSKRVPVIREEVSIQACQR